MSSSPVQKIPATIRPLPLPDAVPVSPLWEVGNPREAWRLVPAANDNVKVVADVARRQLTTGIMARTTPRAAEWLAHFAAVSLRVAGAALSVINCAGDTSPREVAPSEVMTELDDRRRLLQDWEVQRRQLRWYSTDDLALMPHLDAAIDRQRQKIFHLERQQEIEMHEMRLRLLSPGSREAQQLRQKIATLHAADGVTGVVSTAARAQANDAGAAVAPTAMSADAASTAAVPMSAADDRPAPAPNRPSIGYAALLELELMPGRDDPNPWLLQVEWDVWRRLLNPYLEGDLHSPVIRDYFLGGSWGDNDLRGYYGRSFRYWGEARSALIHAVTKGTPLIDIPNAQLLVRMGSYDPLLQLSLFYWAAEMPGIAPGDLVRARLFNRAVDLVKEAQARGVTIQGDILGLVMQEWLGYPDGVEGLRLLAQETVPGDFVYLDPIEYMINQGPLKVSIARPPYPGHLDVRQYLAFLMVRAKLVHPFDRWGLVAALCEMTSDRIERIVREALDRPGDLPQIVRDHGLQATVDLITASSLARFGLQVQLPITPGPGIMPQRPVGHRGRVALERDAGNTLAGINRFTDFAATKVLRHPHVHGLHYPVGFDPNMIPGVFSVLTNELLDPNPVNPIAPPANRDLVVMATLVNLLRASSFAEVMRRPGATEEERADDLSLRLPVLRQELREDAAALSPTLVHWMGEPHPSGRHRMAVDTYLALTTSGLLPLDPHIVQTFLPNGDRWTAEDQLAVHRLVLNPDTPTAVVTEALSRLHPIIMADIGHALPDSPAEAMQLTLGGVEVLAQWQDLSGTEVRRIIQQLENLMQLAPVAVQTAAISTYVALIQNGHLDRSGVQRGISLIHQLALYAPDLSTQGRAAGALILLAAWIDEKAVAPVADPFDGLEGHRDLSRRTDAPTRRKIWSKYGITDFPAWSELVAALGFHEFQETRLVHKFENAQDQFLAMRRTFEQKDTQGDPCLEFVLSRLSAMWKSPVVFEDVLKRLSQWVRGQNGAINPDFIKLLLRPNDRGVERLSYLLLLAQEDVAPIDPLAVLQTAHIIDDGAAHFGQHVHGNLLELIIRSLYPDERRQRGARFELKYLRQVVRSAGTVTLNSFDPNRDHGRHDMFVDYSEPVHGARRHAVEIKSLDWSGRRNRERLLKMTLSKADAQFQYTRNGHRLCHIYIVIGDESEPRAVVDRVLKTLRTQYPHIDQVEVEFVHDVPTP